MLKKNRAEGLPSKRMILHDMGGVHVDHPDQSPSVAEVIAFCRLPLSVPLRLISVRFLFWGYHFYQRPKIVCASFKKARDSIQRDSYFTMRPVRYNDGSEARGCRPHYPKTASKHFNGLILISDRGTYFFAAHNPSFCTPTHLCTFAVITA